MAGPTPVSALIHAATMVTAGVYMIARSNVLFRLAPEAMLVVAVIGCFTAVFAATIAIAQNDLKKVLAYSTMSQLGYMVLACGVGAFTVGMFHVMTHAFFKACLFLGAGSVMHAMCATSTCGTWAASSRSCRSPTGRSSSRRSPSRASRRSPASSRRTRSWRAPSRRISRMGKLFWAIGLFTAGLTALYMFRAVSLTFYGSFRGTHEQEHHLHESPRSMTVPARSSSPSSRSSGGWVGLPAGLRRERSTSLAASSRRSSLPIAGHEAGHEALPHATEWLLIAVSVAVAASGIYLAWKW